MKKAILLIAVLLLASAANAAQAGLAAITVTVDERGDALVKHQIVIDSRTLTEIPVEVFDSRGIRVYDAQKELDYSVDKNTVLVTPGSFVENYSLTVEYTTSMLTSKQGDTWFFSLSFLPQNDYENLKISAGLPSNAKLLTNNPPAIVFLDSQKLNLEWNLQNTFGNTVTVSASYNFEPTVTGPNDLGFIAFALIGLLAIGGAVYYFSRKKLFEPKEDVSQTQKLKTTENKNSDKPEGNSNGASKTANNKQKELMKLLNENEVKVVNELLKEDLITQRTLLVRTGLVKSTLSRTIKKLELKGLVKVNDIGNTNRIELSKEFQEKEE